YRAEECSVIRHSTCCRAADERRVQALNEIRLRIWGQQFTSEGAVRLRVGKKSAVLPLSARAGLQWCGAPGFIRDLALVDHLPWRPSSASAARANPGTLSMRAIPREDPRVGRACRRARPSSEGGRRRPP